MPMIDNMMNAGNIPAQTDDPLDHAEHAAAPTAFGFPTNATTIVLALLGIYGLIYGIHIVERTVKSG